MFFSHHPDLWRDFPELAAGALTIDGIGPAADARGAVERHTGRARERLAAGTESDLVEVQAWRRAFARMGLKPTQVRSAAEALLRRLRKEGSLPALHPLIDLCNAISVAWAIPVAVFDTAQVGWPLEVRRARGDERYLSFGGDVEHPEPDEVVFADALGQAHARRWAHRQSALSAVRAPTASVLVVAEAMHDGAAADVAALVDTLCREVGTLDWRAGRPALLTPTAPRIEIA